MTLVEVLKSGSKFKRPNYSIWCSSNDNNSFSKDDVLAEDWYTDERKIDFELLDRYISILVHKCRDRNSVEIYMPEEMFDLMFPQRRLQKEGDYKYSYYCMWGSFRVFYFNYPTNEVVIKNSEKSFTISMDELLIIPE